MEAAYDPEKPQTQFRSYIRDNHKDNSSDFYTQEHCNVIKAKIEALVPENMLRTTPDLKFRPFNSDISVKDFTYIETEDDLKELIDQIIQNDKVIGLDIEQTNTNTYQGYNCLIQLARIDKNYIIDPFKLHDVLPKYLRAICENENIVKIFYAGNSDLLWLNRDYGVFVVNYFDVHQASLFYNRKKDCSFVGLLKEYCNYEMDKATKKHFQLSDWRIRPLTPEQLRYAALDVHFLIYLRNVFIEKLLKERDNEKVFAFIKQLQSLCTKTYSLKPFTIDSMSVYFDDEFSIYKKELKNMPHKDQADLKGSIPEKKRLFLTLAKLRDQIARDIDVDLERVCSSKTLFSLVFDPTFDKNPQAVVDFLSKNSPHMSKHMDEVIRILAGEDWIQETINMAKLSKDKEEKATAKLLRKKMMECQVSCTKDAYEDCKLIAPDGELLCYTNRRKINWYIAKGIGTLVQENPPIVKLNFEPANRGHSDMRDLNIDPKLYIEHNRINQCVICGQKEGLSKYHVVPMLYRQYFPLEMKAHRAHDILLLCERCLEKANRESYKFKDELARRYNVSLLEFEKPQFLRNTVDGIRKAMVALYKHKDGMPEESRKRLKEEIRGMFEKIRYEEDFVDSFKEQLKKFDYKEDKIVKLNKNFFDYFTSLKNSKNVVLKKTSNKEFKNTHGKLILEKLKSEEELKGFIEEWRTFFIDTLDPQFLPYDWKVVIKNKVGALLKDKEVSKDTK